MPPNTAKNMLHFSVSNTPHLYSRIDAQCYGAQEISNVPFRTLYLGIAVTQCGCDLHACDHSSLIASTIVTVSVCVCLDYVSQPRPFRVRNTLRSLETGCHIVIA
ncbi:hypothetical protein J6590_016891 [Homalodisca vitripennis]|nr:hypothetical protein J6590_016891 [Homalodisca vitripennis]